MNKIEIIAPVKQPEDIETFVKFTSCRKFYVYHTKFMEENFDYISKFIDVAKLNNCKLYINFKHNITEEDFAFIETIKSEINKYMKVGCTGCRYCMPCPMKVDIPGIFNIYNSISLDGKMTAKMRYIMTSQLRKDHTSISNCIQCGKCESHCPQHIEIRKELQNAKKELEGPLYKISGAIIKKVMKY